MPSRQNITRYASEKVQGDDSYVCIRSITLGESEEMRRMRVPDGDDVKDDERELMEAKLFDRLSTIITDWNWVDEEGVPLPKPLNNPSVFKLLTVGEMNFINDCFSPAPEKNSKRR